MKTGSTNPKQRPRGRVLQGGNGNKKHTSLRNQTFDSNGPDVRIRGNAHQVYEKYLSLARDAAAQGDRVAAENYYQHAEHYYRIINAHAPAQPRPQQRNGNEPSSEQETSDQQAEPGNEAANAEQPTQRASSEEEAAGEAEVTVLSGASNAEESSPVADDGKPAEND